MSGVRRIDASVAVKLVLKGEAYRAAARQLFRDSIRAAITLIAPPLFPTEVDSVLRRRVHDGLLDAAKAQAAQRLPMPPTPPWPNCTASSSGPRTRSSTTPSARSCRL
jgi:predicted nucleic acid-binding protein